ncbi:MAG TPA: hypothetical protein VFS71_05200 [Flavobacterium sp.]|uniref:hypothetical protein n=1 Tax=Flavobacterium sp. TaxID=239 RepID=UPI002DC02248|nr:hypothetical protein [Flavobacterium sp.]HEU4789059.1 hypothetical protein [Flavobacterium sp.]
MDEEIKSALFRVVPFVMILFGLFIVNKRKKIDRVVDLSLQKPNLLQHWNTLFFKYVYGNK